MFEGKNKKCNHLVHIRQCVYFVQNAKCKLKLKLNRPLWRQRNIFGARINIMWEEQLVDPPIHYITTVNALYFIEISMVNIELKCLTVFAAGPCKRLHRPCLVGIQYKCVSKNWISYKKLKQYYDRFRSKRFIEFTQKWNFLFQKL